MSHSFHLLAEDRIEEYCKEFIPPAIVGWVVASRDNTPFIEIAPISLTQGQMDRISKYMRDTYPNIRYRLKRLVTNMSDVVTELIVHNWSDTIQGAYTEIPDHWPWSKQPGVISRNEIIKHEGLLAVGPRALRPTDALLKARWLGKGDSNSIDISYRVLFHSQSTTVYWFTLSFIYNQSGTDSDPLDETDKRIAKLEHDLASARAFLSQLAKFFHAV